MAVIRFHHYSKTLSSQMDCNVVFPDEYSKELADANSNVKPLKVVWLCHGGSGDENDWLYHAPVCEFATKHNVAFVIVNANDSCFVDMPFGLKYGTYLGEELIDIVRDTFKFLSQKREDNYIVGLSNGGYGCLYLGLTFPQNYCAIGAFSAGDKADAVPKPFKAGTMNPRVRMFGAVDIHDTNYSIKYLAQELAKTDRVRPRVYHACGSKDPWLDMNLLVKECFETINDEQYAYEYDQIEGLGHEWKLWEIELDRFLSKELSR